MAAVGTEAQIADALLTRLAELSLSPALQVAWPDKEFTPPKDGLGKPEPYLEARLFEAPTEGIGISRHNQYQGFLQVTLVYPENAGAIVSKSVAAAVIQHFKRGTRLYSGSQRVDIIREPYLSPSIQDAPYTRTPVTIRYIAFAG